MILFGSAARGELTRDSDLDFLVIEPEVENPALESVRLRRVLGDLVLAADVIVRVNTGCKSGVMCEGA